MLPRASASQPEAAANFQRRGALVHRIEVQARRSSSQQLLAQAGDHIQPESPDARRIVTQTLQAQTDPARHLGTAAVGKARLMLTLK